MCLPYLSICWGQSYSCSSKLNLSLMFHMFFSCVLILGHLITVQWLMGLKIWLLLGLLQRTCKQNYFGCTTGAIQKFSMCLLCVNYNTSQFFSQSSHYTQNTKGPKCMTGAYQSQLYMIETLPPSYNLEDITCPLNVTTSSGCLT